ncbi:MAG TPA: hypothetical protein VHT75_16060 [Acidimicrobiales bacterium]|nr:hypothetical protein [Acidimicrobiales bacterium]
MALGSRPARSTRRRGRPWLFFAVLATLLVLVVYAALSARSPGPIRQQAQQTYLDQALPAIQQSSQQGLDIAAVRTQTITLTSATMISHITSVLAQTQQTLAAVEKLKPPPPVQTAHSLLVAALDMRVAGTKGLSQALGTALSGQPLDAGVQALAGVGLDFEASDRAYSLFQQAMPPVNPPLPDSRWVPDASVYSAANLQVFVATLRSEGTLSPVHDVSVVVVTTTPSPVNLQSGVEVLPLAKSLTLQIVVANTGNQPEKNLTVSATITPALFGPTQMVRDFVDLVPGQTRTVSLGGLRASSGQVTTLTVKIDTPVGAFNPGDTSKVISFRMQ